MEEQIRRRRCIASVRVVDAGFNLVLSGEPTFSDVGMLSLEVGRLADQLERELSLGVAVEEPAPCDTGKVIYGLFERVERRDLCAAARAVNAAP